MIGQQTKNILRIALAYLYRYDAPHQTNHAAACPIDHSKPNKVIHEDDC